MKRRGFLKLLAAAPAAAALPALPVVAAAAGADFSLHARALAYAVEVDGIENQRARLHDYMRAARKAH